MLGKTHRLAGAVVGLSLANFIFREEFNVINASALVIGSTWGSLFPDIDTKSSTAYHTSILGGVIYYFLCYSAIDFDDFHEKSVLGHRGITHSLLVLFPFAIFTLIIYALLQKIPIVGVAFLFLMMGVGCGILCHIFLDCFNSKGVQLLAPVYDKSISIYNLPIDGFREKIICFILFFVFAFQSMIFLYLIIYGGYF